MHVCIRTGASAQRRRGQLNGSTGRECLIMRTHFWRDFDVGRRGWARVTLGGELTKTWHGYRRRSQASYHLVLFLAPL